MVILTLVDEVKSLKDKMVEGATKARTGHFMTRIDLKLKEKVKVIRSEMLF